MEMVCQLWAEGCGVILSIGRNWDSAGAFIGVKWILKHV